MTEQPSVMSQRILSIASYIDALTDASTDPVFELITRNLPLVNSFLRAPSLLIAELRTSSAPFQFTLPSEIESSVGRIRRAGIVKVRLVNLLESVTKKTSICAIHTISMFSIHSTLVVAPCCPCDD